RRSARWEWCRNQLARRGRVGVRADRRRDLVLQLRAPVSREGTVRNESETGFRARGIAVDHAGQTDHSFDVTGLRPEAADERRPRESKRQGSRATGDRKAVIDRAERRAGAKRDDAQERIARDPISRRQSRPVVEVDAGNRNAEMRERTWIACVPAAVVPAP